MLIRFTALCLVMCCSGCFIRDGRISYTQFPSRSPGETKMFYYSEIVNPPEGEWGSPLQPNGSLAIIPAFAIDLLILPLKLIYGGITTPMARPQQRDPLEPFRG